VQRLLNSARWDADAVRDDPQAYAVEHLSDASGAAADPAAGAVLHHEEDPLSNRKGWASIRVPVPIERDHGIIEREHDIVRALADGDARHGDAIAAAVAADTGGRVRFDPGTLDRALKRLRADGLIAQAASRERDPAGARRRSYRLTPRGRALLLPLGRPRRPCDGRVPLADGEERHGDLILCARTAPAGSAPHGLLAPWREAVPLGAAVGASMGGLLLLIMGGTGEAPGAVAVVAAACVVLRRLVTAAEGRATSARPRA